MKHAILGAIAYSLLVACSSSDDSDGATPPTFVGDTPSGGTPAATDNPMTPTDEQPAPSGTPVDETGNGEGNPTPAGLDGDATNPPTAGDPGATPAPPPTEQPPAEQPPPAAGPGVPGANIADVEDRGAACAVPVLPQFNQLANNARLPDPFLSLDGTRIATREAWTCRREEISKLVQEFELGPKPPKPANVSGSVNGATFTVNVSDGGPSISFDVTITPPTTGTAPFPAMITLGNTALNANDAISGRGVAMINFSNDDIAAQQGGNSRGQGKFYTLYGANHPAGAMMAWAWGVSRLIDALETTPAANIDPDRLGVTGCSRNGKGAAVIGAFDERIALTIPEESGAGGSSLWRVADAHRQEWLDGGQMPDYGDIQTLQEIVGENVWFRDSFSQFGAAAGRLPFDSHMILGLVAPRAMFIVNNSDDATYWLDRPGSAFGAEATHSIWEALGISDTMGSSQVGGHPHCSAVPQAQLAEISAYVDKFLVGGGTGDTNILYSDRAWPDETARWIDWTPPALQ
jgi:hypothetical protein